MIRLTILGQPASKSNRSKIITIAGHASLTKSKEAKVYERAAVLQIPPAARQRLEGPVCVTMRIWYSSERSDLDESLILDVLQDHWSKADGLAGTDRRLAQPGVYRNDRQVREKHVFHGIDRQNPRAEIIVEAMQPQQPELVLEPRTEPVVKPRKLSDAEFFECTP